MGTNDELHRDHVLAGLKGTRTPMYYTLYPRKQTLMFLLGFLGSDPDFSSKTVYYPLQRQG